MSIKISEMSPRTIPLSIDPSGENTVTIRPPDWNTERARGAMLANRQYSHDDFDRLVTQVNVNIRELWELEIWLTFEKANIVVEMDNGETLSIVGDKDAVPFAKFMETLGKLPPQVVYSWHEAVVQVVDAWRNPF